jgi:hypothetical protein
VSRRGRARRAAKCAPCGRFTTPARAYVDFSWSCRRTEHSVNVLRFYYIFLTKSGATYASTLLEAADAAHPKTFHGLASSGAHAILVMR